MSNFAIEIKNVGKKYNITHQRGGYVSLRDVLTNILKNPFKHAKYKAKEVLGKVEKEEFWALKDINLTVKKGEIIGIIGSNGAGKSTLLKLLSKITPPTTGEINLNGRVASLLEVGTGFHPELTGRENIFLNGAILGMTKKEITERFDDIVEFSGVKQFIDTPVKRYSSGMYVRLAFAVAAHMEPDILIVDEVLAVGDAEFQKKSLGKLDSVSKESGRTILFVSHNMGAIQRLCKKTILLEKGQIKMFGNTERVIRKYLENTNNDVRERKFNVINSDLGITNIIINQNDQNDFFLSTEKIFVNVSVYTKDIDAENFICGFTLFDEKNQNVLSTYFNDMGDFIKVQKFNGIHNFMCEIPENLLNEGEYRFVFDVGIANIKKTTMENVHTLKITVKNILGVGSRFGLGRKWRDSAVLPLLSWELKN
ncbi:ABC transporter ATP-binding protein [Candidatus Campbellbacteria bacterium CG22_combo_CG10-13_8_21_14_all_36_13]|uniref:ABC transporter ATP-binding protein n=1 Tax=Candidatus Campbellbacteria bacterium CG22_combo_CG10-13_8_21_14_all_36_13 TaxID=1974529 RepID=A0A2H0DXF2_9BACT|nr:MAG: ABC transporter ATP-binding protein [Candidatus Campbellbacteria bacterium CG22_combo_CG10-13_8_21_14_all_36_13]